MPEIKQGPRFEQFNPKIVLPFSELSNEICNNNLIHEAHLIFKVDETEFPHDPSKVEMLGARKSSFYSRTKGSGRGSTTVSTSMCGRLRKVFPLTLYSNR